MSIEPYLPNFPYKKLSSYNADDKLLFVGREEKVFECAERLAHNKTKLLVLHGHSGSGKSSFLRAGLIPFLEENGIGFTFIKEEKVSFNNVIFIRATHQPLLNLSKALYAFIDKKNYIKTPNGQTELDFSKAKLGCETIEQFINEVGTSSERILTVLKLISKILPQTLILIIDQGEEVLTLKPLSNGNCAGNEFFSFLGNFITHYNDIKLLLTLRTEFLGEFYAKLDDQASVAGFQQYYLSKLSVDQLAQAIERPTLTDKQYGNPRSKYKIEFEKGLPKKIAKDLVAIKIENHILPLMQIVCVSLYEKIKQNSKNKNKISLITDQDYNFLGKIDGIIGKYAREPLELLNPQQQYISSIIFEHLILQSITPTKITRKTSELVDFVLKKINDPKISKRNVLETLELLYKFDNNILRCIDTDIYITSTNVGEPSYEIFHDILVKPIKEWCDKFNESYKESKSYNLEQYSSDLLSLQTEDLKGYGTAKFAKGGTLEGQIAIDFTYLEKLNIKMVLENRHNFSLGFSTYPYPCNELIIKTPNATFMSKSDTLDGIIYNYSQSYSSEHGSKTELTFHVSKAELIFSKNELVKYWSLSLYNFISDFTDTLEDIYRKTYTDNKLLIDPNSNLITFFFGDSLAFIQPANNYETLKNLIVNKKQTRAITAFMVGEVGKNSTNTYEDVEKWFPFEYLPLLSLATGNEIVTPCIKFYDEKGDILKCFYFDYKPSFFNKGHTTIIQYSQHGIGELLTTYQIQKTKAKLNPETYPVFNNYAIVVLLKNISRAGKRENQTIEEKFSNIVRAFATLASCYDISGNLYENLSILREREKVTHKFFELILSKVEFAPEDYINKLFLNQIKSKLDSFGIGNYDFGIIVYQLIEKFKLQDIVVIKKYYKEESSDKNTWVALLSNYYDNLTKYGFFNLGSDKTDKNLIKLWRVTDHLHDILVRIFFRIIDYKGFYQPIVSKYIPVADCNVDWVKTDTSPSNLGYDNEVGTSPLIEISSPKKEPPPTSKSRSSGLVVSTSPLAIEKDEEKTNPKFVTPSLVNIPKLVTIAEAKEENPKEYESDNYFNEDFENLIFENLLREDFENLINEHRDNTINHFEDLSTSYFDDDNDN